MIDGPTGNEYGIDLLLVTMLLSDPTPLIECDSARIDLANNVLEVASAVSTDMIYHLGLRNGDVLLEVNGLPLDTPMEALDAFEELWFDENETDYNLTVLRNSNYVHLDYTIYASSP